ncbi:hypothetical protein [Silvanigrella sp.]|jgi:hypothetical protein|uniref:hypothetical protein n=1 Tax=Silvanigrella sp. TaxID=2024976 RepID=UPI0037C5CC61
MKNKILITLSIFCSIMNSAYACDNETEGNIRISNTSKDCISHLGEIALNNVSIRNELDVTGNVNAINVSLKHIFMEGRLLLNGRSNVTGNIDIVGELIANSSNFDNIIKINSSNIRLNNGSSTKDILVRKNARGVTNTQYLYINNSTVNGNIQFESGKGKVILSNGGRYTGSISGGVVENR